MPALDNKTYTKIVQLSSKAGKSLHGKLAHAHMVKTAFKPCLFLQKNLLNMYCKCKELDSGRKLFDKMRERDLISWNLLISGYSSIGLYYKAMNVLRQARMSGLSLDKFSYSIALSLCAQIGEIKWGNLVHGWIIVGGLGGKAFLTNSLICLYSKCGKLDKACLVFDNADELDNVSWNSLIAGFAQMGFNEDVMRYFVKMHHCGLSLSTYVIGTVLKAYNSDADDNLVYGKMIHGSVVKLGLDLDVVVGTSLLKMYAKRGDLSNAFLVFENMPVQNVEIYNAMITGFVHNESGEKALALFLEMQRKGIRPSIVTFSSILKACSATKAFEYGKQIHAHICKNNFQSDEFIGSGLVELYSLSTSILEAAKCFNATPKLNIVSWTCMILAYAKNGEFKRAIALFSELLASGREADEFIISALLSTCASETAVRYGIQIHGYSLKTGIGKLVGVQNSQICMYAESGDINSVNLTFEEIECPNVVSWSTVIHSNAQHGFARKAIKLFELMKSSEIEPNEITYLGVLTACSHGGLLEEGLRYFESMTKFHCLPPNVKHCVCVADLLGRAGRLADAESFITKSGFASDPIIWRALLSACRVHNDPTMAKHVGEKVIELEPQASSSYVLLHSIYANVGLEIFSLTSAIGVCCPNRSRAASFSRSSSPPSSRRLLKISFSLFGLHRQTPPSSASVFFTTTWPTPCEDLQK